MLLHTMWVPLILLTAVSGVSTECPLILDPPYLEQQLNGEISVNCTPDTTVEGHLGMFWSHGSQRNDESDSYTLLSIPNINWDTTAECTIKINETYNCSRNLQLKVYDEKEISDIAIENEVHTFACETPGVVPDENITFMWTTRDQTNSSAFQPPRDQKVMELSVSREDEGATVSCEALWHLEPPENIRVMKTIYNLTVQYAPEFQNETEYIEHLKKGDNISLKCEAMGNPAPHYTWLKDELIVSNTSDLNIPQVNENGTYQCKASNDIGFKTRQFVVLVATDTNTETIATKASGCPLTLTPKTLVVQYGKSAAALCNTTLQNHGGMGWEATVSGRSLTKNVTDLEWTVKSVEAWSIEAFCYINLENKDQCIETLHITIYKYPDKVEISQFGNKDKPQLQCEILDVAPLSKLQVTWYRNNDPIFNMSMENDNEPQDKPQNKTSTLPLTLTEHDDKASFTCEVEQLLGQNEHNPKNVSAPYTAEVEYKPSIQDCPSQYTGKADEFTLEKVPCKARGNPEPDIYWYYKDIMVDTTKPLRRDDSGIYTAMFNNSIDSTNTTVYITIEYLPVFSCEDHYNVKENAPIRSTCEPDGNPKPKCLWYKDDMQVDSSKPLERHESGQYLIVATNELGQVNHSLSISVLYGPIISKDTTQEFHKGENLTLNCGAHGNPQPHIHWTPPSAANKSVITRGRQIIITEATSTNVGPYICNATNEFGSVTRTITLIMKDKNHFDHNIILIVVLLGLLLAIVVLILIYRNHKKKSGHYEVISDNVPLTSRPNQIEN